MPKIRDLGISSIPSDREAGEDPHAYWMCIQKNRSGAPPPEPCAPSPKPQCQPSPRPKYTAGLPDDAVIALKQQLQQQISQFRA